MKLRTIMSVLLILAVLLTSTACGSKPADAGSGDTTSASSMLEGSTSGDSTTEGSTSGDKTPGGNTTGDSTSATGTSETSTSEGSTETTGTETASAGSGEGTATETAFDLTPESKKIKVSFFIPWWEKADAYQFVFDEFVRKYPGYELDYSVAAGDIQQLAASIQAGTQADIWVGGDPNWAQYVTAVYQDLLTPLDDFLKNDPDYNFNTVNKKMLDICRFVDGKYYSVPYSIAANCLIWNKDVFAKAGLDPEKPPETWTEYYEYAKKITQVDSNGVPSQIGMLENPWGWVLQALRKQYVVSGDGTRSRYNEPWVMEIDEFSDKFDDLYGGWEKLPKGVEFSVLNGNAGMEIGNVTNLSAFTDAGINFGFAKMPRPDDYSEQVLPALLWMYVGIPKGAENPKGGWLFLKYAGTDVMMSMAEKQFQKNPARWFPGYIPHNPTRQKAYDLFLPNVDQDIRELIEKRDKLIGEINYYYPYSPLHSREMEIGTKWGNKFAKNEVNLYEKYQGIHTEFQAELDQWKKDMAAKGWQFPENGNPIPPAGR